MTALFVVIVVAAVIALGGALIYAFRGAMRSGGAQTAAVVPERPRPVLASFHVRDDAAHVEFAVPLPAEGAGEHLRVLLEHEAIAVLKEKQEHGLPFEGVRSVVTYGQAHGSAVEVSTISLPENGRLPEIVAPELVPHSTTAGFDPLAHLGEQEFDVQPGIEVPSEQGTLEPLTQLVELTAAMEGSLRAQGIDPSVMSLEELSLGLLRNAGYQITVERVGLTGPDGSRSDVFVATRAGTSALVVIDQHQQGDHPELSEKAVNEAVAAAAQANRACFVVTDKYGPYMMYEKERHSRVRFITRERLQSFVDSFALN